MIMQQLDEILRQFSNAHGVSGYETTVRTILQKNSGHTLTRSEQTKWVTSLLYEKAARHRS